MSKHILGVEVRTKDEAMAKTAPRFDFHAAIPGCVLWLETSEAGAVNVLRERGIEGDVFIWEDPNSPGNGIVVAYGRTLTDEERATVEAAIVESRNPPPSDMV